MRSFNLILIISVLLFFSACTVSPGNSETNLPVKPNIIFILADDLGYGDLSINGQEKFSTPNIDQMATNGMVFTNHYSGSTVCAPSRSTLLTGLHTGHTPIRGNKEVFPEGQWPMPDSMITLPVILKSTGYVTGGFGKWGLGFPGSEGDPMNQGFDEFFGYNCQRLGHHYYPYYLWHNDKKIVLEANSSGENNAYGPEIIHTKAREFIKRNKDTTFFMYYPSIIPHAELFAPEAYMKKFRAKFDPEKVYEGTDYGDPMYRLGPYGSQDESHAAFAAMVTILDEQVGDILNLLDSLGIAENTIVLFSSDNGPHMEGGADPDFFNSNSIFRGYKRDLYEGGIRVPMIAYMPGSIKAGSSSDHLSAFWDVLPTFAELTGVEAPENIDGISFLPTLLNLEGQKVHDYLYWEFHEKGGRIAVRNDKWKGIRYDVMENPNSRLQLYDLNADPGELNDLADQHPEIVNKLDDILKEARTN
jgi:arylsulfatase A-like enzyme